jgi:hypothetical protein
VLGEQLVDLGVEGVCALVEVFDVAGEVADAAGRDPLDQALAEADPLEPAQLALAVVRLATRASPTGQT